MKISSYILLLASALMLLSCEDSIDQARGRKIALSAAVRELGLEVRSADVYTGDTPLESKLLCSFESGEYLHEPGDLNIPCHTDITYLESGQTFVRYKGKDLVYPPSADQNVYFVGLYPATDWGEDDGWKVNASGTSAIHPVDGTSDLMFAAEKYANWDSREAPVQEYRHLLTWVRILASANTIDAASQWGTIEKVTIKSSPDVTVSFPSTVSYQEPTADITVYEKRSGSEGMPISITTSEVGSVLISPQLSMSVTVHTSLFPDGLTIPEIRLRNTSNHEITEISDVEGNLFVLNLNFTPMSIVEGVCTLTYWQDLDEDIFLDPVEDEND